TLVISDKACDAEALGNRVPARDVDVVISLTLARLSRYCVALALPGWTLGREGLRKTGRQMGRSWPGQHRSLSADHPFEANRGIFENFAEK
ncbi:MAG TPA: hypothetical protein VIY86_15030, partial [Pirellulaceae bacterium]